MNENPMAGKLNSEWKKYLNKIVDNVQLDDSKDVKEFFHYVYGTMGMHLPNTIRKESNPTKMFKAAAELSGDDILSIDYCKLASIDEYPWIAAWKKLHDIIPKKDDFEITHKHLYIMDGFSKLNVFCSVCYDEFIVYSAKPVKYFESAGKAPMLEWSDGSQSTINCDEGTFLSVLNVIPV